MEVPSPAAEWTSYKNLQKCSKKRITRCLKRLDQTPALEEAERIFGRKFESKTTAFSAGRKWICIQFLSEPKPGEEDCLAIIMRVRVPPARDNVLSDSFKKNENAGFFREQHSAKVLGEHLNGIRIPAIYHVSPWGSPLANIAGYPFMLMECVRGHKLRDILWHKGIATYSKLDTAIQDHLMSQWAALVAEISTLGSNHIGPIAAFDSVSGAGGTWGDDPTMMYQFTDCGLFTRPSHYFGFNLRRKTLELSQAIMDQHGSDQAVVTAEFLGVLVFGNILLEHFGIGDEEKQPVEFPLVHRTLTEKNILMDDEFNFVALVDLKDALTLPEELQESYAWDCWTNKHSMTKYHSMLIRAEENEKKKGHRILFPPSKVTDNKLKTAFKLYNNLGVDRLRDPIIVRKLLDLAGKPDLYEPMHYLAGCIARHWSSCYGIAAEWAHRPETGRAAYEAAERAMNPEEDDGRCADATDAGFRSQPT
ncbi:unnamed protein product [Clonostachys rosea]|uniref:Aminoglycoside phosphotransferase domain-containing protein n=1 Tax=Bionectria ochroleuca TaxID=29856 RepID=A0ABY6UQ43_BIOOC|nr:unnamed protein product [Clonostachys rosea]